MKTTHWNTQRGIRSTRRRAAGTALLLATAPSVLTAACTGAGQATGGDAAKPIDLKGTTVEYWTWNPAAHPESVAKEKRMAD
ncbi:MAG TPA: hypothetical protein VNM48_06665, partial [Chloroflexota bacterium]|nr:hypothetical protein [Chloroflexota bacterium]